LHPGSSYSPRSTSSYGTCFQLDGSGTGGTVTAPDHPFVPLVERLLNEQSMLRESFEETKRRLCLLEGTRCPPQGKGWPLSTSEVGVHGPNSEAVQKLWLPVQLRDSSATEPPVQMHDGQVATSAASAMSPASALAAAVRRSEEDQRSAELSEENTLLRQELAEARKTSEALELQQQDSEDAICFLEQQQAWLAREIENARLLASTTLQISSTSALPKTADSSGSLSGVQLPSTTTAEPDAADSSGPLSGVQLPPMTTAEPDVADSSGSLSGVQLPSTTTAEPDAGELAHDEEQESDDEVY